MVLLNLPFLYCLYQLIKAYVLQNNKHENLKQLHLKFLENPASLWLQSVDDVKNATPEAWNRFAKKLEDKDMFGLIDILAKLRTPEGKFNLDNYLMFYSFFVPLVVTT